MEEKELKTSAKQRIWISVIALIMVGSFIASYAAIVISGSGSGGSSGDVTPLSDEKMAKYEKEYSDAVTAFKTGTAGDFTAFSPYVGEVKAYNETMANSGLTTRDLLVGTGRELAEGDTNYIAYYIGWCADESVFDSSLDNVSSPTAFAGALNVSGTSLIEGWNAGVVGMKLGGVREVTIPGELAYGESREICGGYNKPLRFMIMAVENTGERSTLLSELNLATTKLQYASYGIDYDEQMVSE